MRSESEFLPTFFYIKRISRPIVVVKLGFVGIIVGDISDLKKLGNKSQKSVGKISHDIVF